MPRQREQIGTGRRHGSVAKAGKVRSQSNKREFRILQKKVKDTLITVKYCHLKKHATPRVSARRRYERSLLNYNRTTAPRW